MLQSTKKETPMAHIDFRTALQGVKEIEITVTGRTSGRSLSYPVWFALDRDTLYLIPVRGSDTEWYKNLRKTPNLRLAAHGKTLTASARFLTDQEQLNQILEQFRAKYGRNVKSYYPKYDVAVEVPLA
jgi:deazaflavin-dependent oxidoreductase (nitroreductase family)